MSEQLLTSTLLFFGVGIGLYWSLYHAHMIDVLGLDLLKKPCGITSLCMATEFVTTGPTIGELIAKLIKNLQKLMANLAHF